jgi:hypothetical protein
MSSTTILLLSTIAALAAAVNLPIASDNPPIFEHNYLGSSQKVGFCPSQALHSWFQAFSIVSLFAGIFT